MPVWLAIVLFVGGVALAIWATEVLLQGLVGVALALRISAFAVGAALSGLEAENVAVGLSAGHADAAPVALGTVFGGATFLVCAALGLGALVAPLEVRLPRGFLLCFAAAPLLAGLALVAPVTPRWSGAVLLLCFAAAMGYLVAASRHRTYIESDEVEEAREKRRPLWLAVGLTLLGIVVIGVGGELVARGAIGIIGGLGVPALVMGMVVTPAAIELDELFRQAIPAREGRPDVSVGNLVGTLLYFALFNLGLIVLLTPVRVDPQVVRLDWPFLVGATWLATIFLARGRVGRLAGALLLAAYALYVLLHLLSAVA